MQFVSNVFGQRSTVPELLRHPAVDCEVEGVGEVDAEVDGGRDVFCQLVIKKFHHTVLQKRESLIKLKCTGSIRKVVISFRC